MTSRLVFLLFAVTIPLISISQTTAPVGKTDYPQNYFRNPLNIPVLLAGNFGECRPGHFHSGVDIKTKGEENLPVHAAADGYISRIKMEKGGFGHGIYITHPNGYTTLYAHLNDFAPAIQQYVHRTQYEKKRWDVDLQLTASQFPVKKGQLIAYSGNTGGSTAPHLHFEIRNSKTEHPLNPQLFGLPITDNKPTVPLELAFYSGGFYNKNPSYPIIFPLKKAGNTYKPGTTNNELARVEKDTLVIKSNGIVGVGIRADDYMDGSDNSLTFYTAQLLLDDSVQAEVVLDDIGYDVSRYINAYADYATKFTKSKWIQCLFQLPGNKLNVIFKNLNQQKGKLDLTDRKAHKATINILDNKGNSSVIQCYVKTEYLEVSKESILPGSTLFTASKSNNFSNPNVTFTLDEQQLYDDIYFAFSKEEGTGTYSDKYSLHYPSVPLHHYFDLLVKPNKPVPFDLRSKMVLRYTDGKEPDGRAANPVESGWYKASVRNFGTYWLDVDTIPPTITSTTKAGAVLTKAKQITFTAKDEITSVKKFNGYIDEQWVCVEQHGSSFFYKFDEHCAKGKHTFTFKVEDENGNANTLSITFTK